MSEDRTMRREKIAIWYKGQLVHVTTGIYKAMDYTRVDAKVIRDAIEFGTEEKG